MEVPMTTRIQVTTHDWPVRVTTIDTYGGNETRSVSEVPPNSDSGNSLYLTDTRSILVEEMPVDWKLENDQTS